MSKDDEERSVTLSEPGLKSIDIALNPELRKAADNVFRAAEIIHNNSAINSIQEILSRHQKMVQALEAPISRLHETGVLDRFQTILDNAEKMRAATELMQRQYTLPDTTKLNNILQQYSESPYSETLKRYSEQFEKIQASLSAIKTPWLNVHHSLESISGMAKLNGIGLTVSSLPTFSNQVVDALRMDLGDWRDEMVWPDQVATDLDARSQFYESLGVDRNLTNFPSAAFNQTIESSGIKRDPPPLVSYYGPPIPVIDDDSVELDFERTNIAHDWLQRLESMLRRFIDLKLSTAFDNDWPKHRLPNGMYDRWRDKRKKAESAGRKSYPLIAYADFSDYHQILCRKDNWDTVFSMYFQRPENVRESFQRMHFIRIDTMHSRPIGQDDELLLYVEIRRLSRAINNS